MTEIFTIFAEPFQFDFMQNALLTALVAVSYTHLTLPTTPYV